MHLSRVEKVRARLKTFPLISLKDRQTSKNPYGCGEDMLVRLKPTAREPSKWWIHARRPGDGVDGVEQPRPESMAVDSGGNLVAVCNGTPSW